ncbi:unnamed protein product [Ectocarpus sp. 12 AP-2014]
MQLAGRVKRRVDRSIGMLDDVVLPSGLHVYRRGEEAVDTWIVFSYGGVSGRGEQGPQPVYDARIFHTLSCSFVVVLVYAHSQKVCMLAKGAACRGNGAEVVLFFRGSQLATRGHALRRWTGIVESVRMLFFCFSFPWTPTRMMNSFCVSKSIVVAYIACGGEGGGWREE